MFDHVKVCSGDWQTVWKDEYLHSRMGGYGLDSKKEKGVM